MTDPQQLWMLVGGNGAGKSTFFRLYLESKGIQFINADNIAKTLGHENQERLAYQAAKVAGQIREDFLLKGLSFCFETVFSHPSKIDFMADAKARGYEVILVLSIWTGISSTKPGWSSESTRVDTMSRQRRSSHVFPAH